MSVFVGLGCWCGAISLFAILPLAAQDFGPPVQFGAVNGDAIRETSGMILSRRNPGVAYVHNDGSSDRLFAIRTNGQWLATLRLGEEVEDFEEIDLGPGPRPFTSYLYAGDIGDNAPARESIRVLRAPEPAVYDYFAAEPVSDTLAEVEIITLQYPDGVFDAEAMFVDPVSGDLLVITKQSGVARVYRAAAASLVDDAEVTLEFVREVNFDAASAAAISPDGREIILRQEDSALLWRRNPGQSIEEALVVSPVTVPVIGRPGEPNGESIAFSPDNSGYFTLSEGEFQPVHFFPRQSESHYRPPWLLIAPGATWRYLDDGSDQGLAWRGEDFDDSAWLEGEAQLGYGHGDERTVIDFGADEDDKRVTTYFRRRFTIENPLLLSNAVVSLVFDDGAAVYLNGVEVWRQNLPAGAGSAERALESGSSLENAWQNFSVATSLLRAGENTVAVEVHRRSLSENDLSFDLQLTAEMLQEPWRFAGPPRPVGAGRIALDIEGPEGGSAALEFSSDLESWAEVAVVASPEGRISFTNSVPAGASNIFFRLAP